MPVIFLTRKFPPQAGGMETFSWQLTQAYPGEKAVIHFGRRQADIIWVLPRLWLAAVRRKRQASLYHLGDLVLAPLAPLLRRTGRPIVATVHGLELTYKGFGGLYQRLLNWSLPAIDHFVCVSEHTANLLRERGIAAEKISVISHGVVPPEPRERTAARQAICQTLASTYGEAADCEQRPLLLTVGRLVRRKGVAWFITQVLPQLRELNPLYLVVSDGPEYTAIEESIRQQGLQQQVRLLGQVPAPLLLQLYAGADIFVMPNIAVANDVEGFGFVAIEAAAAGLPVVASRIDGIPAAIHHDRNGFLITPGDAQAYATAIRQWITHPADRQAFADRARAYTLESFRWATVAARYHAVFEKLIATRPQP
jgi:phosphatidylinositol alpha-1,6-mannosyltransferase